jgi:hypothetical protein
MKLFNWIKRLGRRGSNAPLSFNEWLATNPIKNAEAVELETVQRHLDREIAALLAFAEGRQQAQSLQIPPPGAEPVATDEELLEKLADLWPGCMPSTVRRTIYQKGRADERTAILRALGVQS